jgi:hypothetical protein
MKKPMFGVCYFILASSFVLMFSGCAGYIEYMKRSPRTNSLQTQTVTRYESTSYEVLGVVTARGTSKCILGIIVEGEEGEGLLWGSAKSEFGDRVTGVKDINVSYEYQSILPPIFSEITSTYVGTAVHEK